MDAGWDVGGFIIHLEIDDGLDAHLGEGLHAFIGGFCAAPDFGGNFAEVLDAGDGVAPVGGAAG